MAALSRQRQPFVLRFSFGSALKSGLSRLTRRDENAIA
jgi:hypothetical protein